MTLETLYAPAERLDAVLSAPLDAVPAPLVLVLAAALGLRHALDPDHLVAMTSLAAGPGVDVRGGVQIGAWWGLGHGATLLLLGVPLVLARSSLPDGVDPLAHVVIGLVIVALGLRLLWHRRTRRGAAPGHRHAARTRGQALWVGALHGAAGSGAVVVLLLASIDRTGLVLASLLLFAAMAVASMAMCTGGFAWVLTRPRLEPLVDRVVVPAVGVVAIGFGALYALG